MIMRPIRMASVFGVCHGVHGHAVIHQCLSRIELTLLPRIRRYPFCDAKLGLDKRLDDLIGRLTIDEKPQLLIARESPLGNISRLGIPEYDWGGECCLFMLIMIAIDFRTSCHHCAAAKELNYHTALQASPLQWHQHRLARRHSCHHVPNHRTAP